MTLDELKDKNLAELTTHLQAIAPAVLEAHERYCALIDERKSTQARALKEKGLWLGDKIRLLGKHRGLKDPIAEVVGVNGYGDIIYNIFKKDGSKREDNDTAYSWDNYEKITTA